MKGNSGFSASVMLEIVHESQNGKGKEEQIDDAEITLLVDENSSAASMTTEDIQCQVVY